METLHYVFLTKALERNKLLFLVAMVFLCLQRIGTALELYERMRSHDLRPSYDAMNQLMVELLRWGDVYGAENMRR